MVFAEFTRNHLITAYSTITEYYRACCTLISLVGERVILVIHVY